MFETIKKDLELLTPDRFYLGDTITLKYKGRIYTRRVYDCKVDLYFTFKNYKFFKYDFI